MTDIQRLKDLSFLTEMEYTPAIVVGGQRASGKTNLLHGKNGIVATLDRKWKFQNVFLFSQTAKYNYPKSFGFMSEEDIYDDISVLDEIYRIRSTTKKSTEKLKSILVILDDIYGMLDDNGTDIRNNKTITRLFVQGRHLGGICVIVLCQRIKSQLSPIIRLNADVTFIFNPKSNTEKQNLKDDYYGMATSKQEIQKLYTDTFKIPYSCAVVMGYKSGVINLASYVYIYLHSHPPSKYRCKYLKKSRRENKNLINII